MSRWVGVVVPWEGVTGTPWAGRCARLLTEAGVPQGPEAGAGLVLVDERCPGTTADDVRRVVAAADPAAAAGVRPVTDTVKQLQDGYVGPTVDRDGLVAVCSPVVLPPDLVGRIRDGEDLPALVARLLDEGVPVVLVEVASDGRRVADADELALLADGA